MTRAAVLGLGAGRPRLLETAAAGSRTQAGVGRPIVFLAAPPGAPQTVRLPRTVMGPTKVRL
ncbi:MAG: hypothetical protein AAGG06_15890, partial [Pseudomonadota bacterium]